MIICNKIVVYVYIYELVVEENMAWNLVLTIKLMSNFQYVVLEQRIRQEVWHHDSIKMLTVTEKRRQKLNFCFLYNYLILSLTLFNLLASLL